jgi:flagellar biosynthesis protein FlhG
MYNLRKMTSDSESNPGRIIAVTSGKGGVGKSTLSLNLAAALTQKGRSVILVDGDLLLPNLHLLAGLQPRETLAHAIRHGTPIADVLFDGPGGMQVACGGPDVGLDGGNPAVMASFFDEIAALRSRADFVVIDTGAGVTPAVLDFAAHSDETWVVTTSESTAVSDAYALIKILSELEVKPEFKLLINRVRSESEGRDVYDRLDLVIRRFLQTEVGYAGHVVEEPRFRNAAEKTTPLVLSHPRSRGARCFMRLADRVS